jgi:hypothetical protein
MTRTLAGSSLLLVDDDTDHLQLLALMFEREGARVKVAANADDAYYALRTYTPNLFVIDLAMPETDGIALLSGLRLIPQFRSVPAVALTAHAYPRDRQLCLDAGFAAHVSKPFDSDELIRTIAELVMMAPVGGPP